MLSYLHAFHAGNFADVHKHLGLYLSLQLLQKKMTPLACIDTHAGSALYDLGGNEARKTAESDAGILPLWQARTQLQSDDWAGFWALAGDDLAQQRYPGSMALFARMKRAQDRVLGFELHPREISSLSVWAEKAGVQVLREDGFAGLLKRLPPREPRVCVLIDPPYEVKSDYARVAETLAQAWQRCRHGVYLIWYPLLPGWPHQVMLDAIRQGPVQKVFRSELQRVDPPERGMLGTGLLLVNPPWSWAERMEKSMAQAAGVWSWGGRYVADWLVPEQA